MNVILSSRAEKNLRRLSKINQIAVVRKIRSIRDNKFLSQKEQLKGYKNIFRVRVGDYRIVYKKTEEQLYIIAIRHRKEVYKIVKKLFG